MSESLTGKRGREEQNSPRQRRKKKGPGVAGVRFSADSELDIASGSVASIPSTSSIPAKPEGSTSRSKRLTKGAEARWNQDEELPPPLSGHAPQPIAEPAVATTEEIEEVPKERKQGQAAAMTAVLPFLPTIQKYILAGFVHPGLGAAKCECGSQVSPTFRCLDCFNSPLWCQSCVWKAHQLNPFHHIEMWDGQRFVPRLYDQPIPIHPGCGGQSCPHTSQASSPPRTPLTICHESGLQEATIQWCQCPERAAERWEQLLAVRLFPATFKEPRTAFTFGVLKQFQVHALASKKSAYDYIKALCQLTDNEAPDTVEKRYREFLFACRLWRYLALERRTGQAHNFDVHVPHRRLQSLALRCPACPEVGFNIDAEMIDSAPENEKHKYTLFVSADGNFKLQRKNKRDDLNDIALNGGKAFFGPKAETTAYVKRVPKSEDPRTCSHLKASKMQNTAKFKNCVISGVVAIQCARHGFYLPQAMIDLLKGEGFAFTDFALSYGLGKEAQSLHWITLTYDIWCQYRIKLLERIRTNFPDMLPIFEKVDGAIGKLHILGHEKKCIFEFNLNLLYFVGLLTGELIETGWAEHNLTGGSTREMNDGHRHDVIDGTSDHWNWDKLVRLATSLRNAMRDAKSLERTRRENFEQLDKALRERHPADVPKWNAIYDSRNVGEGGAVFQVQFGKDGPPTHAAQYMKLIEEEPALSDGDARRKGDVLLISLGLEAEDSQEKIKRLVALSATDSTVLSARQKLAKDITTYRTRLLRRIPSLEEMMDISASNGD
ncbi:hypothetical protein MIND_01413000 [Mycena indigotica]|uniref:CxC2-like cysteine cluster KDZ transposase-associated domain-containing protein n=1 Tax=Mycena indigotica TaxID=2126181 RepID=A0A8H6RX75_9AGAR|nr:uncharacterized protein MIND_01413000 [Mycena indigotica]KAF7288964.1 hypothetical protein MIND_01413000 [Mycena indigotica]